MASKLFHWITLPLFEPELENLYQRDFRNQLFNQIKISFLIGSFIFLVFILMDFVDIEINPHAWQVRFLLAPIGFGLWFYLERKPDQAKPWIFHIVLLGTGAAIAGLFEILIMSGNVEYYIGFQNGLIIVFAYIFGPLALPVIPASSLCLIVTGIMLILGIRYAVPPPYLIEAIFELLIMTIVGTYSRYQLEVFSRRSFLDKRHANEERLLAEQATLAKTDLLRNASHNLRQPMQAIASYTSALEAAFINQDLPAAQQTINRLACSVDLLADSFNKILDISKVDHGGYKPLISDTSLNELLAKIQQHYMPIAANKGLKLKVTLREKSAFTVSSNESLLEQIIGNLVDNAIKYTQQGWVLVCTTKINHGIRLHIVDSGIGISAECRNKIFEPFYRINEQSEVQGCGLGLSYISKAVQNLPQHQLDFYSRMHVGTHFFLDIPVSEAPDIVLQPQDTVTERIVQDKFILLVDDNQAVLHAMGEQLKSYGYCIEKAASVIETKQILENHVATPDLVITDFKLSEGETAESIIQCVQSFCQNMPIIVMSGEPMMSETLTILEQEYRLLKKPINQALLLKSIAQALK